MSPLFSGEQITVKMKSLRYKRSFTDTHHPRASSVTEPQKGQENQISGTHEICGSGGLRFVLLLEGATLGPVQTSHQVPELLSALCCQAPDSGRWAGNPSKALG